MSTSLPSRSRGVGRVLIFVYGILALAATARSVVQIIEDFDAAPVAYALSALSGVVYIVATIALIRPGLTWYRIAWATITFELVGVLVVGTLSVFDQELFPSDSVWSFYGSGYVFIPLVLPILGMIWLYRNRPTPTAQNTAVEV
jgi:hypothetical protein